GCVERGLGERYRRWAHGGDLPGPCTRFVHKLGGWNHLVYEAHLTALLGRILLAQIPELTSLLFAHDASEVHGAEAWIHASDLWAHLAELRIIGCDREIAEHVEHVSTAYRVAVHGGDHGLRYVADHRVKVLDVESQIRSRGLALIAAFLPGRLIAPHAEGLLARTGEDHAADATIAPSFMERLKELVNRLAAECIHLPGPVDRDGSDAVRRLIENVFEFHVDSPFSATCPCHLIVSAPHSETP